MTKRKKTNNDLIKHYTENWKHEPHKYHGELRCSGRVIRSRSTSGTRRVTHVRKSVIIMVGMSSGIIVISPDSQSVSRSTFVYCLNWRVLYNTK